MGGHAGSAPKKTPVILTARESTKPIGIRADSGKFVTLEEFQANPKLSGELASFSSLGYEKQAAFAIARLRLEPPDLKVGVIGSGVLSRDEIIEEIRKGSESGKEFVDIEQAWVERVKEKVSRGEYQLRGQVSANAG